MCWPEDGWVPGLRVLCETNDVERRRIDVRGANTILLFVLYMVTEHSYCRAVLDPL